MSERARTHRASSVVAAARLHRARERRQRGLTLVEGPDLLADVLAAGAEIVETFALASTGSGSVTPVDDRAMQRLAGTKNPRGPVAVVRIPVERLDTSKSLLLSVGVSDPGNVGTMIRTAAAFGWGFGYMEGSADPWAPKTIRAGAGGQFQTAVTRVDSLSELGEWTTLAMVVSGGEPLEPIMARPVALLIGDEAHGLADSVVEGANKRVTITMPGPTESLNAGVAAGIAIHALSKRSGPSDSEV